MFELDGSKLCRTVSLQKLSLTPGDLKQWNGPPVTIGRNKLLAARGRYRLLVQMLYGSSFEGESPKWLFKRYLRRSLQDSLKLPF